MFAHGAVEIQSSTSGNTFKVNGPRLKPYYAAFKEYNVEEQNVKDPRDGE